MKKKENIQKYSLNFIKKKVQINKKKYFLWKTKKNHGQSNNMLKIGLKKLCKSLILRVLALIR